MNWRYFLGSSYSSTRNFLLSRRWFPLANALPFGVSWPYDVARFAKTRDLATIFDVGANVGQTAFSLHTFFPNAIIHCFEPVPDTVKELERHVKEIGAVRIHAVALGATVGTARMTLRPCSEHNAIIAAGSSEPTCAVTLSTLDDFCERESINTIDLLKIDVEGQELQVLKGAWRLLQNQRIRCVYIEAGFDDSDIQHTPFGAIWSTLKDAGFDFAGLYEYWRYPGQRGRVAFCNALFWHRQEDR